MSDIFDFETTEFASEEYLDLIKNIQENANSLPDLKVDDGMIYKRTEFDNNLGEQLSWKLWIPANITNAIIEKAHNAKTAAHGGMTKTLERVKTIFLLAKNDESN